MKKFKYIFGYTILITCAISMFLPFLWMISTSFMTNTEIFSTPPKFIPEKLNFANYINIFSHMPIAKYFFNSLFVSTITTIGQVLIASMAGYAFARFNFKYKEQLFIIILITMMIPPQVNIIPLFCVMSKLNLIDTYSALILPGFFGGFGIFLMSQWFIKLPKSIEEAAKIDGLNNFQIFFKIALPLAFPAVATLAIFTFVSSWNSFMWPLIAINTDAMKTLPVALAAFKGSYRETIVWGEIMACSVIAIIPVILVFITGKKYFINDLLVGSLKD